VRQRISVLILVLTPLGVVGLPACDAALQVLSAQRAGAGSTDAAGADTPPNPTGGRPADASDEAFPWKPGTVVTLARGLVGAVDIDVDESHVVVAVGGPSGRIVRIGKRGGPVEAVAMNQADPTAVRFTSRAIVWTVGAGEVPDEATVQRVPKQGGAISVVARAGGGGANLAAHGERVMWSDAQQGGRIMLADLETGRVAPIAERQSGVSGLDFSPSRAAWSTGCFGTVCGAYVVSTALPTPNPRPVWSVDTGALTPGLLVLAEPWIVWGTSTTETGRLLRLEAAASTPTTFAVPPVLPTSMRTDGTSVYYAVPAGAESAVTRARLDGSEPAHVVTLDVGPTAFVAVDERAVYWISAEAGELRVTSK